MTLIGYTMMCEQAGPKQLGRDVALAYARLGSSLVTVPTGRPSRTMPNVPPRYRPPDHSRYRGWRKLDEIADSPTRKAVVSASLAGHFGGLGRACGR